MNASSLKIPQLVLAIANLPDHIFERIGRGWADYGQVRHEVITSPGLSNYTLSRRAERAGMVHWIDSPRFLISGAAVRCPQAVLVHHINEDMEDLVKSQLPFADLIATASRFWQQRLHELTGREVLLLPYTLDTEHFRAPADRRAERAKAGIGQREFVLGFVGKTVADHLGRKGTDLLLMILGAAAQKYPDLSLVIAGLGWERMAREIQGLGIKVRRLEFNRTEDTVAAYELMDCLLVTSTVEGGPCTILEAMACEVPVITSVVGHVPELVKDGQNGFLCPKRKVSEYLRALQVLRDRPDLATAIKKAARDLVVNTRDTSKEVPKIDFPALYSAALEHYRQRPFSEYLARTRALARQYFRHRKGKK